jgi:hypothetical protein
MTRLDHSTRPPLLERLLDGGRTWGSLDVAAGRYGVTRYRLVVFPPGIARDQRILLRIWRAYPVWGIAAWLVAEIVLMPTVGPGLALAVSTGLTVLAGLVAMALAGDTRGEVRTLTVLRMVGVNDAASAEQFEELRTLAYLLTDADARHAAGTLSRVEHESAVWRVYERMSLGHPSAS